MEQVDLFIEGHRPNERVGARVGVPRARLTRMHGDLIAANAASPTATRRKPGAAPA
jgi:hypothetical protein